MNVINRWNIKLTDHSYEFGIWA